MEHKQPMIEIKNVAKIYPMGEEKVVALRKINLTIYKGEIVCIFGTSGSGKSTLLNQLAGMEKPTRGEVVIGGVVVSKLSEDQLASFRQKRLGFVFQAYNLLTHFTAVENVALPLMFKGIGQNVRLKAAQKMLDRVGLKDRLHHFPNQMSGGQQQRVGIARAFVLRPDVIFADEPTGNLDSKTTIEVMEMIRRFARQFKQTVVLVSHEKELASYADRIITLKDGLVISDVYNKTQQEGEKS